MGGPHTCHLQCMYLNAERNSFKATDTETGTAKSYRQRNAIIRKLELYSRILSA